MADSPTTTQELKNELDIVFRAVWTQELIDNMPDYQGRTDLIGSPIFYDTGGNLDVDMVSRKMGVPLEVVRVSHESWLGAGNKSPVRRIGASTPDSKFSSPDFVTLEPTSVEPSGSSTIRNATTHYQEVAAMNQAKHQYERSQNQGFEPAITSVDGGDRQLLMTLMTQIIGSICGCISGSA